MNYLKLQNELLKASEKRDVYGKRNNYRYGLTEDSVAIADSNEIVFIPKKYFYLDIEKVFNSVPLKLDTFLNRYDRELARNTGITKTLPDGKVVRIFSLEKDEVWIDEKLLKYFDLKESSFEGSNKKEPLYIYEDEELVGLVLPVAH